jgi:hypothetical protein
MTVHRGPILLAATVFTGVVAAGLIWMAIAGAIAHHKGWVYILLIGFLAVLLTAILGTLTTYLWMHPLDRALAVGQDPIADTPAARAVRLSDAPVPLHPLTTPLHVVSPLDEAHSPDEKEEQP